MYLQCYVWHVTLKPAQDPNAERTLGHSYQISVLVLASNITDRAKVLQKLCWDDTTLPTPGTGAFTELAGGHRGLVSRCIEAQELLSSSGHLCSITCPPAVREAKAPEAEAVVSSSST